MGLALKPIPGATPQTVMKAVDKMIVMGAAMDGAALKEAAMAHVKAIEGVDAKGVLSQSDFEAINAGLGKAIASVPTSKVMDVYNAKWCHRELPCPQLFVLVSESSRCAGSVQRIARVQGCGEGGIAVRPEWQRLDLAMYRSSATLQTDGRDAR